MIRLRSSGASCAVRAACRSVRQWLIKGGVGSRVTAKPDALVYPPGPDGRHSIFPAYLLQQPVGLVPVCVVIKVTFAHELIKGVMNEGASHEIEGIYGWTGRTIPCVTIFYEESSIRVKRNKLDIDICRRGYRDDVRVILFQLILVASPVRNAFHQSSPCRLDLGSEAGLRLKNEGMETPACRQALV